MSDDEQHQHPIPGMEHLPPGEPTVGDDELITAQFRVSFASFDGHGTYARFTGRGVNAAAIAADCDAGHPEGGLSGAEPMDASFLVPIESLPAIIMQITETYNRLVLLQRQRAAERRARAQLN